MYGSQHTLSNIPILPVAPYSDPDEQFTLYLFRQIREQQASSS